MGTRISQMAVADALTGAEKIEITQALATRSLTLAALATWITTVRVSVLDYGALGDGTTDDEAAINEAIAAVSAGGGGIVFFPPGTYLVNRSTGAIGLSLLDGVQLVGAGMGVSIIKSGESCHIINIDGAENVGIADLTLDGDRDNATSDVHCLRSGGVTGLTITNLECKNAKYYGIGFETGTQERIFARNVYIHDCGADGLDIKDPNLDNYDIVFDAVKVDNAGMDVDTLLLSQAGVSLRGTGKFSNIFVSNVTKNNVGIRMDGSTPAAADTQGGRRSSLCNFDVRGAASGITTAFGVEVRADSCQVSNGYINGCYRGIVVKDADVVVSNVIVEEALDAAFVLSDGESSQMPDNVAFIGCTAKWAVAGASTRGFKASETGSVGLRILGCRVKNANAAVLLGAAAENTTITNCDFTDNTDVLSDSGIATVVDNVRGYKTFGVYLSDALAGDSGGSKTFTITHGLGRAPTADEIVCMFRRDTSVSDLIVRYITITAVNSTTFSGVAYVGTASATPGATFKVAAQATIMKAVD